MSYGFPKRSGILLHSLELQQGVSDSQIEIITLTNHECTKSRRFTHHIIPFDTSVHKARMLNQGAEKANGEVLVFVDADALLPPFFIANLLTTVTAHKLYTSVRKNLPAHLAEVVISRPSILKELDYQALRDVLPNRWPFDWIVHTPSGFLHVLPRELFEAVGRYDEARFVRFDRYDWEFASRVFTIVGQPILVPDMWAIHLDHVRDYSGEQIRLGRIL